MDASIGIPKIDVPLPPPEPVDWKKRSTDIFFEDVCKSWFARIICFEVVRPCCLVGLLVSEYVRTFGKPGKQSSGSWVLNLTPIFGMVGWFTEFLVVDSLYS